MNEIFKVYVVYGAVQTSLQLDPIIGVFSSSFNANEFAIGKGRWGYKANVKECNAIVGKDTKIYLIDETPIDLDQKAKDSDEKLKLETLASLTNEQKRVLGF